MENMEARNLPNGRTLTLTTKSSDSWSFSFTYHEQFNWQRFCYCIIVNSRFLHKATSREPAYSQAFIQNQIDRQRVRSKESGRQSNGYGG